MNPELIDLNLIRDLYAQVIQLRSELAQAHATIAELRQPDTQ